MSRDILDDFQRAYAECALWSSIDDKGQPLDHGRDASDIAPETIAVMRTDCDAFRATHAADLKGIPDDQAGHDFWLTRNGHGAGFWDRGLGARGERLTEACTAFPQMDLYVGDDGKVYQC